MSGADQQQHLVEHPPLETLDLRLRSLLDLARDQAADADPRLLTDQLVEHLRADPLRPEHLQPHALKPRTDHYARHCLYRCPDTGIVLFAMVWQAGQGSPIHDHSGAWGVMTCLTGRLSVIDYSRHDDPSTGTVALRVLRPMLLEPTHTATTWAPGREIHRIHNHGPHPAISVHLYSNDITSFSVFHPTERTVEQLTYEA